MASQDITIDLAQDLPLQIFRSINRASVRSKEAPLRLSIINSGSRTGQLAKSEGNIVRLIFDSLARDNVWVGELAIHITLRSSLPHPFTLLYTRIGRGLHRLSLHYDIDDGAGGSVLTAPPPALSPVPGIEPGQLTNLSVGGNMLLDLLDHDHTHNISIPLVNLCSLEVANFSTCLARLSTDHIICLFVVLRSLTKLGMLRMEDFNITACLRNSLSGLFDASSGIPLQIVSVSKTNGDSLTFLLRRLIPDELRLEGCSSISYLPHCTTLTLQRIPPSNAFATVLSAWNGDSLDILSCPFFGNPFLAELQAISQVTREPLWPHLRYVNVQRCTGTLWRWLQILEIRSRWKNLLPTHSSRKPEGEQIICHWADASSQSVTVVNDLTI